MHLPFSNSPYGPFGTGTRSYSPVLLGEAGRPDTLQAMIDNLVEQVALVDASGTIAMVNKAWAQVASSFHLGPIGVGDNYREVCRKFVEQGHESGSAVLAVLHEFDEGRRVPFEHVYCVPWPKKERFYKVVLSNVVLNGARFLAVACYEMTDLVALQRRNHELEQEKLHIQQEEGRRIGRDIHDTTSQDLAVLRLSVSRLKSMHGDAQSLELFGVIDNALTHVIDDIRAISFMLHPPSLEGGLVEALGSMARGFARRTTLRIDFRFTGVVASWGEHVEEVFYRIAQEALTNVHRHAAASNVKMQLVARCGYLHLVLDDDGIGIAARSDNAGRETGVGIASMRSRVRELSGHFSIRRLKPGTRVLASAPVSGIWPFQGLERDRL